MRIYECWFCGKPIYPGHGITFVRNDTKVLRFCKRKCHKHYKMKRNPRKLRWTKVYRRTHGKEMIVDSTLDFVKKRNRPMKYNRNQMQLALRAIKRIHEIRQRRNMTFYTERLKHKKSKELKEARVDLTQNINLIAPSIVRSTAQIKAKTEEITMKTKISENNSNSQMEY